MGEQKQNLPELIQQFWRACSELRALNKAIGQAIVDALRDIIPDLEHSVGWAEAGVDTICFFSKSRSYTAIPEDNPRSAGYVDLTDIIVEIDDTCFDSANRLCFMIDTPFGVYLKKHEAEMARQRLLRLFGIASD